MEALTENQQRIVDEVVRLVRPLRVMVFGSVGRREARSHSDLDLLVVMPEGTHRRRTAQRLYAEVPRRGIALDVLVTTPDVLAEHADDPGFIYGTILREGQEVYAA